MKSLIKLTWHCFLKTFANMRGEDHRICILKTYTAGIIETEFHCTCGKVF